MGFPSNAFFIISLGSRGRVTRSPDTPQSWVALRERGPSSNTALTHQCEWEGVAAMDGGHVAGVIKEVGADGAQGTG